MASSWQGVQPPVAKQQQPVVVRHQSDDLWASSFVLCFVSIGSLGNSLNSLGKTLDSAAKDVDKTVTQAVYSSPLELLKDGYVVQLISKVGGKCLRVLERGQVDCLGEAGTSSQFEVVVPRPGVVKLRSVSTPQFYLAITGGYLIGYGQGGLDCEFVPSMTMGNYLVFESLASPGGVIGALPSGLICAPMQTPKTCDAAHFGIKYITSVRR
ncbi:hypothetical protein EMCRGX_G011129 [Ephydatia muelleri]